MAKPPAKLWAAGVVLIINLIALSMAWAVYDIIPCSNGLYVDVRTSVYPYFVGLEKLTKGYVQVDSNE